MVFVIQRDEVRVVVYEIANRLFLRSKVLVQREARVFCAPSLNISEQVANLRLFGDQLDLKLLIDFFA